MLKGKSGTFNPTRLHERTASRRIASATPALSLRLGQSDFHPYDLITNSATTLPFAPFSPFSPALLSSLGSVGSKYHGSFALLATHATGETYFI